MGGKKIIIIGGNAAGPSAAAKAKRVDPSAEITLFEAGDFISTGTCELPYVIADEIKDYNEIVYFNAESFYEKKGVKVFTNYFVEDIDRRNKSISMSNLKDSTVHVVEYDKLILATGSFPKKLPSLAQNISNLFYLKSISDYLKIKQYLDNNSVKSVLIIGAGFIGLESAEAFKSIGLDVTIIEKEKLPMPGSENEIQCLILDTLTQHNVEFIGGFEKVDFNISGGKIDNLKIDGRIREFDLYLSAVGFKPNSQLALNSRLEIGNFGGIKVDSRLKTSDPNIFAAGDNIEVINKITGKNFYLPVATIAHRNGHISGENAAGGNVIASPVIKNIAVKIFDMALSIVGLNSREAGEYCTNFSSVNSVAHNLVSVMPGSRKVFGKLIYDTYSKQLLGASFFGGREVIGFADQISSMIYNKSRADTLAEIDYNYTPPFSPFVNLLSVLGRKIK